MQLFVTNSPEIEYNVRGKFFYIYHTLVKQNFCNLKISQIFVRHTRLLKPHCKLDGKAIYIYIYINENKIPKKNIFIFYRNFFFFFCVKISFIPIDIHCNGFQRHASKMRLEKSKESFFRFWSYSGTIWGFVFYPWEWEWETKGFTKKCL